jgi:hypothetical protein
MRQYRNAGRLRMKFFYNPFRAVKAGIRKSLNPAMQGVAFDAKLSFNNALYIVFLHYSVK